MDPGSGEIRSMAEFEGKKGIVPLYENEVVQFKGCYFEIKKVEGTPHNLITLHALPKLEGSRRFEEQKAENLH